jgi:hypothetical protein
MSRAITRVLACTLALSAASALAGPLATDPNAYNDGVHAQWHGSTPFSTGTLVGYIDWAVYDPAHAPAGLAGYARTPGELIYTYQATETGAAALSSISVDLQNVADNIGTFTATGVAGQAASSENLAIFPVFDSATWSFAGVLTGGSTIGMVFSSPNVPMDDLATELDHGQVGVAIPVPSPSKVPIPEPGTLTLAACGLMVLAFQWLRRRGRTVVGS